MKNYEKIMNEMTAEKLAELSVHLVTVDNKRLFYLTSPGQLFPIDKFQDAVNFELAWLNFDPENNVPDTNEEQNPSDNH